MTGISGSIFADCEFLLTGEEYRVSTTSKRSTLKVKNHVGDQIRLEEAVPCGHIFGLGHVVYTEILYRTLNSSVYQNCSKSLSDKKLGRGRLFFHISNPRAPSEEWMTSAIYEKTQEGRTNKKQVN